MRTIVGTMTGTSMDGVDAVAVEVSGYKLAMTATFHSMASVGLGTFQTHLRTLAKHGGSESDMQACAFRVGSITQTAISALELQKIDLIALHGQTIYHKPPNSIQLIDVEPISKAYSCTILTDPRKQDLNLGGEGAPITPLADWIMFRSPIESTAIVNLGGFSNITLLPKNCSPDDVTGFDLCACNLLLNTISSHVLGTDFDEGGKHALKGIVHEEIAHVLLTELQKQHDSNRSLGTNDDLSELALQVCVGTKPEDALASAATAIGRCINQSTAGINRVLLAGGGVHNRALANAITHQGTTALLGVPTQAREGMAMAILGALAQDGVSITLPQITGREQSTNVVGWTQVNP